MLFMVVRFYLLCVDVGWPQATIAFIFFGGGGGGGGGGGWGGGESILSADSSGRGGKTVGGLISHFL